MDLAAGTGPRHRPILGDLTADHQFDDLAPLGQPSTASVSRHRPYAQCPLSGITTVCSGSSTDQAAGGTRMVLLPARLLAAGLAQRARRRLLERRVRGRGLAGVVAVFAQMRFEFLHPREQLHDLGPQRSILGTQGLQLGVPSVRQASCGSVL